LDGLTTLFKYVNGSCKAYLRFDWKYVKERVRYLVQC